jgi:hypothetical protein
MPPPKPFISLHSLQSHNAIATIRLGSPEPATRLMAVRQRAGQPGEPRDTMIAGIVLAHHATLATRNTRHLADLAVPVVNPWET